VLYFAVIHSFLTFKKILLINKGTNFTIPQRYIVTILGDETASVTWP